MSPAHLAVLVLGLLVLLATTSSVVRTLVVPRALRSRIASTVQTVVARCFHLVADRVEDLGRRDELLAWVGPMTILLLLISWLLFYLTGYSMLEYATGHPQVSTAIREAGSSLFTLGFAATNSGPLTAVDFAAAATGPLVVGLQVGYLPTLYAAYNRREVEVSSLEARAGNPAWGPEILARHTSIGTLENLRPLYERWERWAADVAESHTNYPVLVRFRSPDPRRDWLIALLAVADSAALHLALSPSLPQGEARICVRAAFTCLRDLARSEGIAFDPDPDPDAEIALPMSDFAAAVEFLVELGYPAERSIEEAWPHFRGWRINYEAIAYELAQRLDAPPALWSGPRHGRRAPLAPERPLNRQPGGRSGRPRPGG
jgi:hypothetical protein